MEHQALSQQLDKFIAVLLEQKRRALNAGRKRVRVLITGDNASTLPKTLLSLSALDGAGYQLMVTFSHTASISGLKTLYINEIDSLCSGALYCEQEPAVGGEDYSSLFLPALSTNSLSKIALGIRDNIACGWVFHALNRGIKVIATLNPECLSHEVTGFTPPLLNRLFEYASVLEQYGIAILGQKTPGVMKRNMGKPSKSVSLQKHLITLSDILTFSGGEDLRIENHTLITPAAQDEIRRQNITVIQGF
jgi:hypothetical protein